ncbi:Spy/CpxP family protein refolding chaperone [Azoarcus sp. PA01]|nr:Spy/CpxP family protein refolding chaperone [Azoarcus sp. PA01]
MKTWIKTAVAAAVAATAAFSAPAVIAGGGGGWHDMHGGMHGGMHGMKHRMDPEAMSARADRHLAQLQDALALRPEQRPAWETFSAAMRSRAQKAAEQIQSKRSAERPMTAPERMERMETFAETQLESMREMHAAAAKFYDVLDAAQKKTFDEQFHVGGRRHWGERQQRPAGMEGPAAPTRAP